MINAAPEAATNCFAGAHPRHGSDNGLRPLELELRGLEHRGHQCVDIVDDVQELRQGGEVKFNCPGVHCVKGHGGAASDRGCDWSPVCVGFVPVRKLAGLK